MAIILCQFQKDRQGQLWLFQLSRASNTEVNSLILPKFELIWEFMAAPVTCKFDEDLIKIEGTIDRTRSNMGFFATQGLVTPKFCLFVCVEVLRPSQQLRSCQAGQLLINTVPGQA